MQNKNDVEKNLNMSFERSPLLEQRHKKLRSDLDISKKLQNKSGELFRQRRKLENEILDLIKRANNEGDDKKCEALNNEMKLLEKQLQVVSKECKAAEKVEDEQDSILFSKGRNKDMQERRDQRNQQDAGQQNPGEMQIAQENAASSLSRAKKIAAISSVVSGGCAWYGVHKMYEASISTSIVAAVLIGAGIGAAVYCICKSVIESNFELKEQPQQL